METSELERLMNLWSSEGSSALSALDFLNLKTEYLLQLGTSTCTSCPHWKDDMFFHFRNYLKSINRIVMSANTKYIIKKETGSIRLPGEAMSLVNKGGVGDELTDELAEAVLKKYPDLSEHIIPNPEYVAPEAKKKDEEKK